MSIVVNNLYAINSDAQSGAFTVQYSGIPFPDEPIVYCEWLRFTKITSGNIFNLVWECDANPTEFSRACIIRLGGMNNNEYEYLDITFTQGAKYDCMALNGYDAVARFALGSSTSYYIFGRYNNSDISTFCTELNINGTNTTISSNMLVKNNVAYVRYKFKDSFKKSNYNIFSQLGNLTSVKLSDEITILGEKVFSSCSGLTSVELSQETSVIGNDCFYGCKAITNFEIPDKVKVIGDWAFGNCTSLTAVTIPNSVTNIGLQAFSYCTSLKKLLIPGSVTTIGSAAFRNCTSLESVKMYDGITSTSSNMFIQCNNLKELVLPSTLLTIGQQSFAETALEYLIVPNSVTAINSSAFAECTKLASVVIGENVTSIGGSAFFGCSELYIITCYASKPPSVGSQTFYGVRQGGTLYYPSGSNYSTWLSIGLYYLGYYGWNDIGTDLPDFPEPDKVVFELEYNTYTAPKLGIVTTLRINSQNIARILVNYPWWVVPTQKNGYFDLDIYENERFDREESLEFIGVSIDGQQITQNLKITQEGIEDMATGIALYKMRMNYPASGGTQYIQVDYMNPNVINDPYCSQSWVSIKKTQEGYYYEGENKVVQRQYAITMAATTFERQISVKFSCTDEDNNEVSNNKLVLYQSAPTVNPDDGEGETHVSAFSTIVKVKINGTPEYSSGSDLGVGYENLIPSTPTVDVDWIHLGTGVKDTGVSTYDTVMRYPTTYDENTGAERTGTITWVGVDGYGTTYTASTEVTQFGTDTPVDEGMITLKSLSVTIPAYGGSDTVEVEYYDAKTIYEPEFEGDWATITELSSSSSKGVAWNGTECIVVTKEYKITAQPTDYGRQAKVIFRADINYYDGGTISMEKDKFRVIQLAEGQEESTSVVYPFRNTLTYDHKGYSTSWGSVRVGYKDVAIDTPTIGTSNWLRLKSTKDVTYSSKEYDKILEYEFELDENNTSSQRSANVTFTGFSEDGSKTAGVVTIIQSPYENVIDTVATNYKGYFTSMEGDLYSVSFITDPSYDSYGEITLAGESPVVVSYTEEDRLFSPTRTSTCSVKVVTSQYLMNLYTGKAQGTQVIVKHEGTDEVKWCGFLQPNLYNQGYAAEVEELEFVASDCISTLQYMKYEDYFSNGRMSVPFSYIIGDMMDKTKLIKSYYITKKYYNDNLQSKDIKFNNFYISEHNFFSEEDEPWTLLEVLEETCKFFGYVCLQWGDSVYFLDYDFYTADKTMLGYRYDKSDSWIKSNYVNISDKSNSITSDSYRGNDGNMSLDDVFNKVSVNCNYFNVEGIIPDLFEDNKLTNRLGDDGSFRIRRYTGTGNSVLSNETYYRVYDHKDVNNFYYTPLEGTSVHESKSIPTESDLKSRRILEDYVGANIIDMIHLGYNEANGKAGENKDWERYLMISQLNRPWCGAEGTFHWENYNFPIMEFKNIPTVFLDNRQESTGRPGMNTKPLNYLVIEAEAAFVALFKDAYLSDGQVKGMGYVRNISCYKYMDNDNYVFDHVRGEDSNDPPALCFYLEIPKKGWWNGSDWVDYKTHFEAPLECLDYEEGFWATTKGLQNTVGTNLFLGKTGYKIPLPIEMDSTEFMYFAIAMPKRTAHLSDSRGGDYTGDVGNAYCFIKNFKVSICNLYTSLWGDKDVVYENIIDADNVIDGDEIDLKITSDNGRNYSLSNVAVMTTEDRAENEFTFYTKGNVEALKPEEAIIDRYVRQYSTPSIKEEVTVDLSFMPHQLVTDTYWEKDFVITSQELDYKNDCQRITLLEKK